MCLSAVARSNKLCIVVTIDKLVGVQRSAIVRCADFLLPAERPVLKLLLLALFGSSPCMFDSVHRLIIVKYLTQCRS